MPKGDREAHSEKPPSTRFFQIFNEIGIINQLASTEFQRALPHGLTLAQFSVLNHCVRLGDGMKPADLADAFQITRGTLSTTLKRLAAKGFVKLAPDHEDGRAKRVLLTDAGRQARADAVAAAGPLLQRTEAILSPEKASALLPILQELRQWLDEDRSARKSF